MLWAPRQSEQGVGRPFALGRTLHVVFPVPLLVASFAMRSSRCLPLEQSLALAAALVLPLSLLLHLGSHKEVSAVRLQLTPVT